MGNAAHSFGEVDRGDHNLALHASGASNWKRVAALSVAALGVVYGDISTSPLYAINEIFLAHGHGPFTAGQVKGAISLVVWALTVLISVKYLVYVLRADNDGQGGVFALYGLLSRSKGKGAKSAGQRKLLFLLMIAAGMLFGDGIITPAISVFAAVEGLEVATPAFAPYVIPITLEPIGK